MKREVIVVNPDVFNKIKKNISEGGRDNLHVLSDFDRTITYGLSGEKRTPTVISQLRSDPKYLGAEYKKQTEKWFEEYHPIEVDSSISLEEKKAKMHEWWMKYFEFLVKCGFNRDLIKRVVKEMPLKFRKGSLEFLSYLNKNNIPLIFMSAAPGDMLIEYIEQNGLMFPNVYVISNRYKFNSKGKAVRIKEPIIHTFNKTEITLEDYPIFNKIKNRKNVLLIGDSYGDVGMIEGFDYKNLLKVGFYNDSSEGILKDFTSHFDVVLTGDQDFGYVNKLLKEILNDNPLKLKRKT